MQHGYSARGTGDAGKVTLAVAEAEAGFVGVDVLMVNVLPDVADGPGPD